jgi:SAM-dependent methyltransferase
VLAHSVSIIEWAVFGDKKLIDGTLNKLLRHLRENGFKNTAIVVVKNIRFLIRHLLETRFDKKFRIDTAGSIALEDLVIESHNKSRGVYYEPTPPSVFRYLLSKLNIDHREFEFIDFGCGKGRVVVLATLYPFKKITGIEFSSELAKAARRNIVTSDVRFRQCANVDILCMDASQFSIPNSKAVLYFYNPFDAVIMETILLNIEMSFQRSPTEKIIIYYNPQNEVVFRKFSFLKKIASAKHVLDFSSPRLNGFSIYKTIN